VKLAQKKFFRRFRPIEVYITPTVVQENLAVNLFRVVVQSDAKHLLIDSCESEQILAWFSKAQSRVCIQQ
jgi:hypothetical protein